MTPCHMVAVTATDPALLPWTRQLAASLGLPLVPVETRSFAFLLTRTAERLELCATGPKAEGPVYVHFDPEEWTNRHRPGQGRRRDLAIAAGLRRQSTRPHVLDATAGLGRDSYILALLGCQVTMMERSPIVAALLEDGLERARRDPLIGPIVRENLSFIPGDALHLMNNGVADAAQPDVIYLDPMHPPRSKSALVRKEMRRLRAIVGDDPDAQALLAMALRHARRRVVIKRPRHAEPLSQQRPTYEIVGQSTRYDVYLIPISDQDGCEATTSERRDSTCWVRRGASEAVNEADA
ncbi:MAG: class I SAM-dependent methyltransferase [Magnetococcales bacterium]|nr:class I SAM-dependent methyltransferase [Magnetococcales bacterium]